eukprot:gene4132-7442_t
MNPKKFLEAINCFDAKDRNRKYLTFVEACPWWLNLFVLFGFLLVIVSSVTVVAIIQAPIVKTVEKKYNYDTGFFFNGTDNLQVNIYGQNPTHQAFTLLMHVDNLLYGKNTSFTFQKNDLIMNVKIEGRLLGRFRTVYDRKATTRLSCRKNRNVCTGFVLRVSPIHFDSYQIKLGIENGIELVQHSLIGSQVYFTYSYTDDVYTTLAITLRSAFIIISIIFTIIYFILLIRRQQVYYWSTEQKFLSILLILTVLFNNPIFFLEFVLNQWIFQFLNTLFAITFYCFLMLSVLVMTHSVITVPQDRGIIWFFVPKFMIVGAIWMFTVTIITIVSFTATVEDYTVGLVETTTQLFLPFFFVILILLLVFFSSLLYHFVRALSKITQLPKKLIQKAIFFWVFTFITLALIIVDILLFVFRVNVGAAQFNIFLIAFNAYTLSISVLYFPTNSIEFKNEKEEEEERQSILRTDEPFEDFDE